MITISGLTKTYGKRTVSGIPARRAEDVLATVGLETAADQRVALIVGTVLLYRRDAS